MNWRNLMINPVLEKEFRLRMRTPRSTASILFYLAAISVLVLGFVYVTMSNYGSSAFNPNRGQELFYFISCVQLVLISFMTPGLTAGVISGEREKQTLNILLTTRQTSTAIILSKLVASLSFMTLVVFSTLPIYSIVFLYGGVSPGQLTAVFLFYLFYMLMLGSVGILFSTLIKKTMIAVITTYGFLVFIAGFTAVLALFAAMLQQGPGMLPGIILSFNPMGALISVFMPEFSREVLNNQSGLELWHIFVPVYTLVTLAAILLSIRYLRPVLKKRK